MESRADSAVRSVNIEVTPDFSEEEWRSYVSGASDATHAHRLEWREIIRGTFGYEPAYLVARRDGRVCGVLPAFRIRSLLLGRHFISMPFLNAGGVCASDSSASEALLEGARVMMRDDNARHFELRCTYPPEHGLPALRHKVRLLIDLPDQPAMLWSSLRSEIRNRTKHAQKAGLSVEFGSAELSRFYRVFSGNMRELGVPAHPLRFFRDVLSALPEAAELAVVKDGTEVIGGAILIYFKDTVEVPWISSSRAHFASCPNNILYWEAMRRACERGMKLFDFGRSSVGSGPATFKLRWGARPSQLYWQYILNDGAECPGEIGTGNPRFKLASRIWSRLPYSFTNFIGPKLIAHLPG